MNDSFTRQSWSFPLISILRRVIARRKHWPSVIHGVSKFDDDEPKLCVDVLRGIIWMLDGGADHIFWDDNLRVDLIGDPKIASLSTWIGP